MPDGRVLEDALILFRRSAADLATTLGVSPRTLRNWRKSETNIAEDCKASAARFFGVQSWNQLRSITTRRGDIFTFDNLAADLGTVWEFYIENCYEIFETRIALSANDSFQLGFSERINERAIKKISEKALSIRRVEQVFDIERLMQLHFNSERFKSSHRYALRVIPPGGRNRKLVAYPNIVRFGRDVLALGRLHTEGMPTHEPFLILKGSGVETFANHIEKCIWDDGDLFTSELDRACLALAKQLEPGISPAEYDSRYAEAKLNFEKKNPRI